jgi:hypothetical protein
MYRYSPLNEFRNSASSFRKRKQEALNISITSTDDISDVFYETNIKEE